MFDDLVEYVRENYSRASKIVELGVGSRIDVAENIKKHLPLTEVLVTDKDEAWVRKHITSHVRAVADDVMFPQTPIYQNALRHRADMGRNHRGRSWFCRNN